MAGREHSQHPRVRAGLSHRAGREAGGQLPEHGEYSGDGRPPDRPQLQAEAQTTRHHRRAWRAGADRARWLGTRGGRAYRFRDHHCGARWPPGAAGLRDSLPRQRALPLFRTRPADQGRVLPTRSRPRVLQATRDSRRCRVATIAPQPAGRRGSAPRGQRAAPGDRPPITRPARSLGRGSRGYAARRGGERRRDSRHAQAGGDRMCRVCAARGRTDGRGREGIVGCRDP